MQTRDIHKTLKRLFTSRRCYFDVIVFWVETNRNIDFGTIPKQLRAKILKMKMHKTKQSFNLQLTVYQVRVEDLKLIADIFTREQLGYIISHIEITVDWITKTSEDANRLKELFITHFVHSNQLKINKSKFSYGNPRFLYRKYATTSYFGLAHEVEVEAIESEDPENFLIAFYPLDEDKFEGKPCAHFEYRLKGAKTCNRHNIKTISDLQSFSFPQFMRKNVTFCKVPYMKEIKAGIHNSVVLNRSLATTTKDTEANKVYENDCKIFLEDGYKKMYTQRVFGMVLMLSKNFSPTKTRRTDFSKAFFKALFDGL